MLELNFAALRDQLYIERMEEAAAEEEMILKGELQSPTSSHQLTVTGQERTLLSLIFSILS